MSVGSRGSLRVSHTLNHFYHYMKGPLHLRMGHAFFGGGVFVCFPPTWEFENGFLPFYCSGGFPVVFCEAFISKNHAVFNQYAWDI